MRYTTVLAALAIGVLIVQIGYYLAALAVKGGMP